MMKILLYLRTRVNHLVGSHNCLAGQAYKNICDRIMGEEVPLFGSGQPEEWLFLKNLSKYSNLKTKEDN